VLKYLEIYQKMQQYQKKQRKNINYNNNKIKEVRVKKEEKEVVEKGDYKHININLTSI